MELPWCSWPGGTVGLFAGISRCVFFSSIYIGRYKENYDILEEIGMVLVLCVLLVGVLVVGRVLL